MFLIIRSVILFSFALSFSGCLEDKQLKLKKSYIEYHCTKERPARDCMFLKALHKSLFTFKKNEFNKKYFDSVYSMKLFNKSQLKTILSIPKKIVRLNKMGKYNLEILIHDFITKEKEVAFLLQYDFTLRKTNNLVFENAHTIYLR
jgi:hypothetical protein